jgi:ZIP family zinc transporter
MSFPETIGLGALAGFTIFLGLPTGRLQLLGTRARVALAMFSVGILAFIFVDVLSSGLSIVHHALDQAQHHDGSVPYLILLVALLGVGFLAGSSGLAAIERRIRPAGPRTPPIAGGSGAPPIAGGSSAPPIAGGSSAATVAVSEAEQIEHELELARRRSLRTGLTIAAAIGVHNFAEGLAIGVSARAGAISLATVLIIGFGLHNATEGFGIVGPLGGVKPSWGWLGLAGLIAGAPTFLGTMVGYAVTSHPLELAFYAAAGGAIMYVIGEIWNGMRRYGHRELGLLMLSAGFMLGVVTDLVITAGGG